MVVKRESDLLLLRDYIRHMAVISLNADDMVVYIGDWVNTHLQMVVAFVGFEIMIEGKPRDTYHQEDTLGMQVKAGVQL